MKGIKKIVFIVAICAVCFACKKDNKDDPTASKAEVYIFGQIDGNLGVYKNGESYIDLNGDAFVSNMFFIGNDLYFVKSRALYKNNQKMYDFETYENYYIRAAEQVFSAGNDVWMSCIVDIDHEGHSLLWKNGQIYIEPTKEYQGIFVNKNDIYAYDHINGRIIKNGTVLYNNVCGIFFRFSGDNLYWLCDDGSGSLRVYKNGQAQYTLSPHNGQFLDMAVIGNDVYLLQEGYQNDGKTVTVWKNNQIAYTLFNSNTLELQEGEKFDSMNLRSHMTTANGSVYVSANVCILRPVSYYYETVRYWATVWKDQQVIFEKENAVIYEILVK
jgi:hypothetical protein